MEWLVKILQKLNQKLTKLNMENTRIMVEMNLPDKEGKPKSLMKKTKLFFTGK